MVYTISIFYFTVPATSPDFIKISATSPYSIFVEWNVTLDETLSGSLDDYTLKITDPEMTSDILLETQNTSLLIEHLRPYTKYLISISFSTSVGDGPFSREVTVLTPEDGMCL